jgi:cell division protease FtsH
VAGLGGVKRDLQEIVDYLKDPVKFQRLGARVPKGVLLMGPPGTGKTLLARAVAGEAGVPFFSINGSEFIQLFVGVGAGRVRDMFNTAKEAAPAILFIDEIDAVGRQRGAGLGGGHDEREQTLNQILSEMDGFSPTTSVIVLAATNRPDVLDPALLRPGRFDRHITVDRPTIEGRKELFAVHSKDMPLADDVDFDRLAKATVGLTGADIRNLVNEAALWATRHDKDVIEMEDFEVARDKVLMGAKREDVMTEHEKRITAYHEAGHALLAWIIPGVDLVHKVTVIPRGRALGVTQLVPLEDRYNLSQTELEARLTMMLGGRTAEKLILDELSAGSENDLKEATRIARKMVSHWGMSERLGPMAFHIVEDHPFLGREIMQEHREFSEHTARIIDEEVAKILHAAEDRAEMLLSENREKLELLAEELLDNEVLDRDQIEDLIGPSVNVGEESRQLPARIPAPATLNVRQRADD